MLNKYSIRMNQIIQIQQYQSGERQNMIYKLPKSKSNPSKINIVTPMYSGSKLAPQTSREFSNRSISGSKKFGVRPMPISPSSRQKQNKQFKQKQRERSKTKIQINSLNFNLVFCQKQSVFNSPTNSNYLNNNSSVHNLNSNKNKNYSMGTNSKLNYFKSNNTLKTLNRINETIQKRRRMQVAVSARFQFNPIKILAKGQYGNIYLAYSKQTNFLVVLKSFNKEKVTIDFMIDEFKIQLYCRHPNILPAYGFFFAKTQVYLIMQAGTHNLYHEIKQTGYLTQRKTATYIHQILKGLSYLHLNGIIHRDLKPQNIIICGTVAKITDFGWSIITSSERKTYCGTLDYVSPEVCYGVAYDNKIDCWSVGVLVYEMITGFPPFQSLKTTRQRPILNYKQKLKFPSSSSQLCRQFVLKMLSIDPKQRPSIVQAMRDDWIQNYSQQFSKKQNNLMQVSIQS